MKRAFKKIVERLEGTKKDCEAYLCGFTEDIARNQIIAIDEAIRIVNQVAKEYEIERKADKCGWIPCGERQPNKEEYFKNDGRFIVTDGNRIYQGIYSIYDKRFMRDDFNVVLEYDDCVIAWHPLPEPYKPEEEKQISEVWEENVMKRFTKTD